MSESRFEGVPHINEIYSFCAIRGITRKYFGHWYFRDPNFVFKYAKGKHVKSERHTTHLRDVLDGRTDRPVRTKPPIIPKVYWKRVDGGQIHESMQAIWLNLVGLSRAKKWSMSRLAESIWEDWSIPYDMFEGKILNEEEQAVFWRYMFPNESTPCDSEGCVRIELIGVAGIEDQF